MDQRSASCCIIPVLQMPASRRHEQMFVIRAYERGEIQSEHVFSASSGLEAGDDKKIAIASLMNLEVTQFARNGALYRTEPRSRNFVCVCVFMYRDFHHVNWRFKCKCAAIVLRMTIRIVFFLEAIFCVCGEFYVSIHGERAVTSVSILS